MNNEINKKETSSRKIEKRKKRILIFSLGYYPNLVGGAEVAIKEITDRFDPQEWECDMVTLRFDANLPKKEKIGNVNVYRMGFAKPGAEISDSYAFPLTLNKYLYIPLAFWKASVLHWKKRYDAVWGMMVSPSVPAALFRIIHPHVPYVLDIQDGYPPEEIKAKAKPIWPLFRAVFTKADRIKAISNFLAEFATEMGHKKEIEIIRNGVAITHFRTRDEVLIEEIKKKFNKQPDEKWIITTSRLQKKNGVNDLIESLVFLPENVRLMIAGIGDDLEMLENLAKEKGVEGRVEFLGFVDHSELPAYLHASDIFSRPSLSEGLGCSFIEAMAAGLPVVSTPVGGIPDFLFHEKTGLFCEVGNGESLAKQVRRLLEDEELRKLIITQANAMVDGDYDWDEITKKMEELFEEVIK